jgi:signal peptidase I
LFAAFLVPSASMSDTLLPGDYVLVARCAYGLALPFGGPRLPLGPGPRRGDVLVFRAPDRPGECLVKRCVALAGETVAIVNKRVIVGGDTLVEPTVHHGDAAVHPAEYDARDNLAPLTLETGQLFVLGDNRDDSEDSRFWGPVRDEDVIGRALLIYWSWDDRQGRPRWNRILRCLR